MSIARVVGVIGRVLVGAGLLLLFYTAYLLVGTNVYTQNAQKHLAEQLAKRPAAVQQLPSGEIAPAKPATEAKLGDPLFSIVIEKIALKTVVVQGARLGDEAGEREALSKGPAHFPGAPYPGEDGNVAISGHRTTFGAPFFRLDQLQPGDAIAIESGQARYNYTVTEQLIVAPSRVDVIGNRGKNELTLTTCHPKFSAAQRLIVHARYDGSEFIAGAAPPPSANPGPSPGGRPAREPTLVPAPPPAVPQATIVLALLAVVSALSAMALSSRLRPAAVWSALTVSVGVGLWVGVFPQVLRLMPANY